jgi:hypothetical protein
MKRAVLVVVAALALFFGVRALLRVLASEETQIRRVVDEMIEGFNDTRMDPILDGLDREYVDETYGVDRQLLRAAAASLFFQAKDPGTKAFLYRAAWSPSAPIALEEGDVERATLEFDIEFFRKRGVAEDLAWKVHVSGRLEKREGDWRFVRTETVTRSGDRIR